MQFYQKLNNAIESKNSRVCIGLDPVLERLPRHLQQAANPVLTFLEQVVEATQEWAAAYKPNFAYFEALGPEGLKTLEQIIEKIPADSVIIGDAKRGDVGHSAAMYAKAVFETFSCDAVTVSPYQGEDALQPFLEYEDKGTFVLCLTSNPGADDFQVPYDLYLRVAEKVKSWNVRKNCGLVVGATRPGLIQTVREVSGPMPFLIPGVGAQGGDLEETIKYASDGTAIPYVINASRSVLYASNGEDFAQNAGEAAKQLCQSINAAYKSS
ncbi:MAG: orotidine-5'-phosphate decarboxylase [SAR324 cluster bacterium]|nr:orotidine-5'-phosphate decarboxylase [SAR324 cluster bacterium]